MPPGSQTAGDRRFTVKLRYLITKANALEAIPTHHDKVTLLRHDLLALKLPHPRAENVHFGSGGLVTFSWVAPTNGVLHKNLMRIRPAPAAQKEHDRLLKTLSIEELSLEVLPPNSREPQMPPRPPSPPSYKKSANPPKRPYPYDSESGSALKFPKQEPVEPLLTFNNPPRPDSISSSTGASPPPEFNISTEFLKSVLDSIHKNANAASQPQRRPGGPSWSQPHIIAKQEPVVIDLSFSPPVPQSAPLPAMHNPPFTPPTPSAPPQPHLSSSIVHQPYTPSRPLDLQHPSASNPMAAPGPTNLEPYVPPSASTPTNANSLARYDPSWSLNRSDSGGSQGWRDIPDYWGHWQHQTPQSHAPPPPPPPQAQAQAPALSHPQPPAQAQPQTHAQNQPLSSASTAVPGGSPFSPPVSASGFWGAPLPGGTSAGIGAPIPGGTTDYASTGFGVPAPAPAPAAAFLHPTGTSTGSTGTGTGAESGADTSVTAPKPTKPPFPPGYIPALLDSLKSQTQGQAQAQVQTQAQVQGQLAPALPPPPLSSSLSQHPPPPSSSPSGSGQGVATPTATPTPMTRNGSGGSVGKPNGSRWDARDGRLSSGGSGSRIDADDGDGRYDRERGRDRERDRDRDRDRDREMRRDSGSGPRVNGYPRFDRDRDSPENGRGRRDRDRETNGAYTNGHGEGSTTRHAHASANGSPVTARPSSAAGSGSTPGQSPSMGGRSDAVHRLTKELWDVRKDLKSGVMREREIVEELRRVGAEPVAESSLEKNLGVMRAKLQLMETALESERKRRKEMEDALEDVKRECREPFVVPALLDAFVALSKLSSQLAQLGDGKKDGQEANGGSGEIIDAGGGRDDGMRMDET